MSAFGTKTLVKFSCHRCLVVYNVWNTLREKTMPRKVRYSKPLVIRLRPEQRERLEVQAEDDGLNVSEYVRQLIDLDSSDRKYQKQMESK